MDKEGLIHKLEEVGNWATSMNGELSLLTDEIIEDGTIDPMPLYRADYTIGAIQEMIDRIVLELRIP